MENREGPDSPRVGLPTARHSLMDSLDTLDLIFKLEEEFNIEIPEGESRFVTVQDVITYVQEKTKGE